MQLSLELAQWEVEIADATAKIKKGQLEVDIDNPEEPFAHRVAAWRLSPNGQRVLKAVDEGTELQL